MQVNSPLPCSIAVIFDYKQGAKFTHFKASYFMITLNVDLYKYGSFKEKDQYEFSDESEACLFIENAKDYTDFLLSESKACGESLIKWTAKFIYNGIPFNVAVNL